MAWASEGGETAQETFVSGRRNTIVQVLHKTPVETNFFLKREYKVELYNYDPNYLLQTSIIVNRPVQLWPTVQLKCLCGIITNNLGALTFNFTSKKTQWFRSFVLINILICFCLAQIDS